MQPPRSMLFARPARAERVEPDLPRARAVRDQFPEDVVIEGATLDALVGSRGGDAWMARVDGEGRLLCTPP
jgi:hypothetical protein